MKQKIIKLYFLVLFFSILLYACQGRFKGVTSSVEDKTASVTMEAPTSSPDVQLTPNPSNTREQSKKALLLPHQFREQILSKDKSLVLLNADFSYPQIENLSGANTVDSINKEIKENTQEAFDKSFEEGRKAALEFYDYHKQQGRPSSLLPFVTEQMYEVKYNDNYIISVLVTSFSYFGGAHPNTLYSSYTYHLLNGEKLPATYFLTEKIAEKDEKQYVAKIFLEAVKKDPDKFYPDAEQILKEGNFDYGYYITDDSVVFYMNPYVIAPYVAGLQEVSVARVR